MLAHFNNQMASADWGTNLYSSPLALNEVKEFIKGDIISDKPLDLFKIDLFNEMNQKYYHMMNNSYGVYFIDTGRTYQIAVDLIRKDYKDDFIELYDFVGEYYNSKETTIYESEFIYEYYKSILVMCEDNTVGWVKYFDNSDYRKWKICAFL